MEVNSGESDKRTLHLLSLGCRQQHMSRMPLPDSGPASFEATASLHSTIIMLIMT